MEVLTRDQAIERIRDIKKGREIHHLYNPSESAAIGACHYAAWGAIRELMAIFDIKEEEL